MNKMHIESVIIAFTEALMHTQPSIARHVYLKILHFA